jgi:hypothetical protein
MHAGEYCADLTGPLDFMLTCAGWQCEVEHEGREHDGGQLLKEDEHLEGGWVIREANKQDNMTL